MTERQKKDYLDGGGNRCPFCLSTNITAGETMPNFGTIDQEVTCEDCKQEWIDLYNLVGVTQGEE